LDHTCGVTKDNRAYCRGYGGSGKLGDGSVATTAREPVAVAGDHRFVQVKAGLDHTCGITPTNGAYCWGDN
jgi:alpha-tubulin suppressor-like RCC1 family protein